MSRDSKFVITKGVAVWDEKSKRYVTESVEGYDYEGPWALATHDTNPTWVAQDFRFYLDDAAIGSVTAIANENTAISRPNHEPFILVMNLAESAGASVSNVGQWILQYQIGAGGWNNVTGSSPVQFVASPNTADGATFTSKLGNDISGVATWTSSWNEFRETTTSFTSRTWSDNGAEYAWCLKFKGATIGDVYTFRVLSPSTSTAVTPTNTPTVTVSTKSLAYSATGTSVLTKVINRVKSFSYTATGSLSQPWTADDTSVKADTTAYKADATVKSGFSKVYTPASGTTYYEVHTYSATGTLATPLKAVGLLKSYSATGTNALTRAVSFLKSFSATGTQAVTKLVGLADKAFSATGTSVLTYGKSYIRSFTYSGTGTNSLSYLGQYVRSLTYSATGTSALTYPASYVRSLAFSATGTSTLLRDLALAFSFNATGTLATLTQKVKLLTLSFTATGSSVLTKAHSYLKSLTYSATGTNSLLRGLSKLLSYSATGTSALAKAATFLKSLAYSATGTLATLTQKVKLVVLAYSATGSAQISKSVGKVLAYEKLVGDSYLQ